MNTPEITRIRAALAAYQAARTLAETLYAVGEFEDAACNSAAITAMLAHIDAQQAEIELLRADAARYRWLKKHTQWLGWEHDFRPDEAEREIDAAMKETP